MTCHDKGVLCIWNIHSLTVTKSINVEHESVYSAAVLGKNKILTAGELGLRLTDLETDETQFYYDDSKPIWFVTKLSENKVAIAQDLGNDYGIYEFNLETEEKGRVLFNRVDLPYTPFVVRCGVVYNVSDKELCAYDAKSYEKQVFATGDYLSSIEFAITTLK
jgi:hypothetical protein